MDYLYEGWIRPFLFRKGFPFRGDVEKAHEMSYLALRALAAAKPLTALMRKFNLNSRNVPEQKPIELFGLKFPNRVGLAAGFDKQARMWSAAGALGFGHVEVGTVTFHSQGGNEKPRIFRFPEQEAAINSMGFPNDGAEEIARRLESGPKKGARICPLGVNIGKSKITLMENAVEDYLSSFRLLAPHADYVVVNVSCPNVPNLRELHERSRLVELLGALQRENGELAARTGEKPLPLLLKISPDLTFPQVDDVISVVSETDFSGIIATNTTTARPAALKDAPEKGGLSGAPLARRAVDVVRYIVRATNEKLPVIGCGGICSGEDADRFFAEGAALVQIYTGMVYRGPFFGRDIAHAYAWSQTNWPGAVW